MVMKIVPYKKIEWNPAVQGSHREVLRPGQAVGRRPLDRGSRRAACRSRRSTRTTRTWRSRSCGTTSTSRSSPTTWTCATSTPTPAPSRRSRSRSSATTSSTTCARSSTPRASTSIPKPVLLPNTEGVRAKPSLHPILEPFDLKGVGLTGIRYLDPDRQDDTWLYLPTLRRVRRLSSAQRSDALFGQDTDVDSYGGYAGQIPWFTWKFLGDKKILGTFHAEKFPVEYCPGGGDFVYCDNWEKRDVWVVEGVAEAAAVRLRQARPLHRQGDVLHRLQRHLRQGRPALEGVDQPVRLPQQGRAGLRRHLRLRRCRSTPASAWSTCSSATRRAPRCRAPSTRASRAGTSTRAPKTGLTEEFFTIAHMIEASH